jgi:hypothetical protein
MVSASFETEIPQDKQESQDNGYPEGSRSSINIERPCKPLAPQPAPVLADLGHNEERRHLIGRHVAFGASFGSLNR